MTITDRQRLFVAEYLKDLSATKAAIRAGYSLSRPAHQGWRLLQDPEVREAIESAMVEREKRAEVDQDYVLSNLREIVDRAMGGKPIYDDDGVVVGTYEYDPVAALRANELLAKHLGMLKEGPLVNVDMRTIESIEVTYVTPQAQEEWEAEVREEQVREELIHEKPEPSWRPGFRYRNIG